MWTLPKDRLPDKSGHYLCYMDLTRVILYWNLSRWIDLDGETFKPITVDRWLDDEQIDSKDKIYIAFDDFNNNRILEISFDRKVVEKYLTEMEEMGVTGYIEEHTIS